MVQFFGIANDRSLDTGGTCHQEYKEIFEPKYEYRMPSFTSLQCTTLTDTIATNCNSKD